MSSRAVKELIKTLQKSFSRPGSCLALAPDDRRTLQAFVAENNDRFEPEDSRRANIELRAFFRRYVESPRKSLGGFVGVLRELQPLIVDEDDLLEWWLVAIRPILKQENTSDTAIEQAGAYGVLSRNWTPVHSPEHNGERKASRLAECIPRDLLDIYLSYSTIEKQLGPNSLAHNARVTENAERVIFAYSRQEPLALFYKIDSHFVNHVTRSQALALLIAFLSQQPLHVHLVTQTSLLDHLLISLLNDRAMAVVSAALMALLMMMPHITSHLVGHLPKLFLVYSRLLCWECFDSSCTEAQRFAVLDDRLFDENEPDLEREYVGLDKNWIQFVSTGPEEAGSLQTLPTFFTYLYGMFPFNLAAFIRKPRRYLKGVDFPNAENFDLNRNVIRERSDRFRASHSAHPSLFTSTVEEELTASQWTKLEPEEIVVMCESLKISSSSVHRKMEGDNQSVTNTDKFQSSDHLANGSSPTLYSSENNISSDGNLSAEGSTSITGSSPNTNGNLGKLAFFFRGSTVLPNRGSSSGTGSEHTYLQHQLRIMKEELQSERCSKAKYSAYIGQLMRHTIRDATAEAETRNLISTNRALKRQIDQIRNAREATIKDSILTRKQASNIEANLLEKISKLKIEQETWQAEANELRTLREETTTYRELLVVSEAKELNACHRLELLQREMEKIAGLKNQLSEAQNRLRGYEFHDFEFQRTIQNCQILENENHALRIKVAQHEDERDRVHNTYQRRLLKIRDHVTELSLGGSGVPDGPLETARPVERALAESQIQLSSMKRAYADLLNQYNMLESEIVKATRDTKAITTSSGLSMSRFTLGRSASAFHEQDAEYFDLASDDEFGDVSSNYVLSSSEPASCHSTIDDTTQERRPSVDEELITSLQPRQLLLRPSKQYPYDSFAKFGSTHESSVPTTREPSLREAQTNLRSAKGLLDAYFAGVVHGNGESELRSHTAGIPSANKSKHRSKPESRGTNSGAFRGLRHII